MSTRASLPRQDGGLAIPCAAAEGRRCQARHGQDCGDAPAATPTPKRATKRLLRGWYALDSPEGEWTEEHPIPTIYKDIFREGELRFERIAFPEADAIVEALNAGD